MKLSVIIVNYNVRYFLEQALIAVRKASEGLDVEVFVVDNNSVDSSVQMVNELFPEVHLIANTFNEGFAKANNRAIRVSTGEYVLLLNPDTVVEESTFHKVIAFMDAHPEAGGLGVKMIDGTGNFLPESKRGFPSPDVAFYKTFGLSKLFPKSKLFNRYHLGYLSPDETHEVDVLSGAFMLLRKETLDKSGLLDEDYFMYGEDIDLSYCIQKAGYKNYYFADTCIIHYKGESTKKGSLNYVKTFYQAMIIFAKKHFSGRNRGLFIALLHFAIWFRASISILTNFFRKSFFVLADSIAIFGGMYLLKNAWASLHFNNPWYYDPVILYFNFPLYIGIWTASIYLSGGYDRRGAIADVIRGIVFGTFVIAAVYGFLDPDLRFSRMLILMGAIWSVLATVGIRVLKNLIVDRKILNNNYELPKIAIVGDVKEAERVLLLLQKAQVSLNYIGAVDPDKSITALDNQQYIGQLHQLPELVHFYQITEIIFCSHNLASQDIIRLMSEIGPSVDYKIVPEGSAGIIGSNSKNAAGDIYTVEIRFHINTPSNKRNKRVFDLIACICLLPLLPLYILFRRDRINWLKNYLQVFIGIKTWIGYQPVAENGQYLPKIKLGVYSPLDGMPTVPVEANIIHRINFLYAKDYQTSRDFEILFTAIRKF